MASLKPGTLAVQSSGSSTLKSPCTLPQPPPPPQNKTTPPDNQRPTHLYRAFTPLSIIPSPSARARSTSAAAATASRRCAACSNSAVGSSRPASEQACIHSSPTNLGDCCGCLIALLLLLVGLFWAADEAWAAAGGAGDEEWTAGGTRAHVEPMTRMSHVLGSCVGGWMGVCWCVCKLGGSLRIARKAGPSNHPLERSSAQHTTA